jgi:RNA polymerase sigma factor (sigma-70 family)
MLNETELVEQLKTGNEQAFRMFVEQWQDMVFNTAVSIVQNEEDADDITQDVFIKVFQTISSFKGESRLSTWLYRITITKTLDVEKKRKRKKRLAFIQSLIGNHTDEEIHPVNFDHPGIQVENKERASDLFRALKKLPDTQRIAFTLQKLEGLSNQEVAAVMNMSVAAVESILARANKNLRKYLLNYYTGKKVNL